MQLTNSVQKYSLKLTNPLDLPVSAFVTIREDKAPSNASFSSSSVVSYERFRTIIVLLSALKPPAHS